MRPSILFSWISTYLPPGLPFALKYCSVHSVIRNVPNIPHSIISPSITDCYYQCLYKELPSKGLLRKKNLILVHISPLLLSFISFDLASFNQDCQQYIWGMYEQYIMIQIIEETVTVIASVYTYSHYFSSSEKIIYSIVDVMHS